jgi:hypothetical protein
MSALYQWTVTADEREVKIKLSFPRIFNPDALEASLSDDKTAISIAIPDAPPIVKGTLFAPAESLSLAILDDSVVYTLVKAEPGEWGPLIKDFYPGTADMDPSSLLVLWYQFQEDRTIANPEAAQMAIIQSANFCFVPALRILSQILIQNPATVRQAQELLEMASQTYNDAESTLVLAQILSFTPGRARDAFQAFATAAEQGSLVAKSQMAAYLSPLSHPDFPDKNVGEAVRLLNEVREIEPEDPIACHELAKLLNNGVGIEKNEERARELQAIAVRKNPRTPPLSRKVDTAEHPQAEAGWGLVDIGLGVAAAAMVIGGAFGLIRYFRRRK